MEKTGAKKGWITGTKVLVMLLIAAVSIFVLSPYFSARGTYQDETDYLDEKLANANRLALGSTSISYLVSLLPDDHGTPIANELAKISGYLLAVISAVMLEKFLLTALGFVSFAFIIPILKILFNIEEKVYEFVPWQDTGPVVLPSGSASLYLVKQR